MQYLCTARQRPTDTSCSPHVACTQLPLTSAYSTVWEASNAHDAKLAKQKQRLDAKLHEPAFTNLTKDFKGTLDYIWYTSNSLLPTAVLELPSEAEVVVGPNEFMPNATYSSDHIALMSEFQYVRQ
jgi:CCR4-NOT transcription complex subunit 6